MNNLLNFSISILKKYLIRILFLITSYFIFGYFLAFWPILIEKSITKDLFSQVCLIFLGFFQLSFSYLKEILIFPIYNFVCYKLKLENMHQNHTMPIEEIESGKILSRFQRLYSVYSISKILTIIGISGSIFSTLYIISKKNITIFSYMLILLLIYLTALISFQNFYKKIRLKAWQSTENVGNINIQILEQTIAVRQNLISQKKSDESFEEEQKAWYNYYLKSNLLFGSMNIILVFFLIIGISNNIDIVLFLLIWNFSKYANAFGREYKRIYSMWIDIEIFFKENNNQEKKRNYSNELIIKNLYLNIKEKKAGPINFSSSAQIITIHGENGAGKTRLALAIANIIKYEGEISSPSLIYISSDTKKITKNKKNILSKGENAILIIEKTLKTDKEFIIIDELLDFISESNLDKINNKIKKSKKKILIISHKKEILKLGQEQYELSTDFKLIKKY